MMSKILKDSGWFLDLAKLFVAVLVSTVTATVTATWTVRGMLDDHDARIKQNTVFIEELKANIVPRKEHEARWMTQETANKDIKEDLRDIRTDVKTLLRKP